MKTLFEEFINNNFNVGDIVCCISIDLHLLINKGGIYTIHEIKIYSGVAYIKLEEIIYKDPDHCYNESRFRLATPEEIKQYKFKKSLNKFNI
jgi:hypothetical protein